MHHDSSIALACTHTTVPTGNADSVTGVGADASTIESAGDRTPSQGVKLKRLASTLCLQGCFLVGWLNLLIAQLSCHEEQPLSTPLVRFPG